MRGKNKSISLASTFFILAIIAFSICSVQHFQTARPTTQTPQLIPPPPSAPLWTYTTGGYVRAVAVSEDGSTIVAGSYDNKIYVFGRQSNATMWTYKTSSDIYNVAVSANGSTIVAGAAGPDNTIRVFGKQSNTTIWTYRTGSIVWSVAVSADGNTIAAGSADRMIRVFSRQDNATIWAYYADPMFSVAVSADGNTIVGGDDDRIYVFGRKDNTTMWTYKSGYNLFDVAVSANGNTVVAGCKDSTYDNYVRVFSRQSNTTLWNFGAGTNEFFDVAVSSDGTTIGAGCYDHHLRVFERTSNASLVDYDTGRAILRSLSVSSDGSTIACGSGPTALSYSKSYGPLWSYVVPSDIGSTSGESVAISGDGSVGVYGCSDNKLYVFQYDTTPPVLGSPSVFPSSPVGGQNVNVSVSVTDNVEISGVYLYYWNISSSSWSSVAMSHTGAAYKATVGPFSSGEVVSYYVAARDTSGNTAGSPADAPLSYYTITIGTPPLEETATPEGIQWTSVVIGAGLGVIIAMIVSLAAMRGKRSGR
nr:WD40 repeat domain-containing protein [Candidatus Njordarchaeum guaymaensis]